MAASFRGELFVNELCFIMFEETTGYFIFWLDDTCGLFFNSETAVE